MYLNSFTLLFTIARKLFSRVELVFKMMSDEQQPHEEFTREILTETKSSCKEKSSRIFGARAENAAMWKLAFMVSNLRSF